MNVPDQAPPWHPGRRIGTLLKVTFVVSTLSQAVAAWHDVASAEVASVRAARLPNAPSMSGPPDASWAGSATLDLSWDFIYRSRPAESTVVRVAQDASALDVIVQAQQHSRLSATQTTNGPAVTADDNVTVALWPKGSQGFVYTFTANVLGARYQTSSENTAYSPQWGAVGSRSESGFVIAMRIPFNIIRSGGSSSWRMQVVRYVASTGALYEWTYSSQQTTPYDPLYAGVLEVGQSTAPQAARPGPRLQVYGLEQIASPPSGGSTARLGADVAIPITPTASFVATVHPDFSNVEIDQQTIAPAEFPRVYQEVRPFFSQLTQSFNNSVYCATCPLTLYTPSIPAFRDGYAVEGTQGPITFAAFRTDGYGRNDAAEVATYSVSNTSRVASLSLQSVSSDIAGVRDDVETITGGYEDVRSHLTTWLNLGQNRGTFVSDPAQASWLEYGVGYTAPTTQIGVDRLRIGSQFAPFDGYVSNNDIDGWSAFFARTLRWGQNDFVRSATINISKSYYKDSLGQLSQAGQTASIAISTKALIGLSATTGSTYLRLPTGDIEPFNQNGVSLTFRAGTSTPASSSFNFGRYYHGELTSWYNYATVPLVPRLRLAFEIDRTQYFPDDANIEVPATQWLQRASLDVQLSRYASLDVGIRRIQGIFAPTGFAPPARVPIDAGNLSAAFHLLNSRNELFVVYGDPNGLSTTPAVYIKVVRYIGASKGT